MSDSHKAKKTKAMFFRTRGSGQKISSRKSPGSMVIYTPTRTKRGKIAFQEVDATSHHELSDEEMDTPCNRKIPKAPSGLETVQSTLDLFRDYQDDSSMGGDNLASFPRKTNVSTLVIRCNSIFDQYSRLKMTSSVIGFPSNQDISRFSWNLKLLLESWIDV